MSSEQSPDPNGRGPPLDSFPDALGSGTTVLLCGFDPEAYLVGLRCLLRFGGEDDSAVSVTMSRGVEATVEAYTTIRADRACPMLGIVDMVSEGQSISATHSQFPTVFTPSQGDTERLVVALSELTDRLGTVGERHLVIESLSPMLERTATSQVTHVLERISGVTTPGGIAVIGLDYTRHDQRTVEAIAETADRVLWITEAADGEFRMDLRSTRSDFGQLSPSN